MSRVTPDFLKPNPNVKRSYGLLGEVLALERADPKAISVPSSKLPDPTQPAAQLLIGGN